ncbi:hypothetical protein [Amycolatopsis sp. NPDC051071]|uniref:hypothetical protein n=1 Tax=Amycolatopsis sp. NPDC051071 TaxID=3154637 RepID=UPI003428A2BE
MSSPDDQSHRFTTSYQVDGETGELQVYDAPDGQWSAPVPFCCCPGEPKAVSGWGFGLAVVNRNDGLATKGRYGWDGGLGTSWAAIRSRG